MTQFFALLMLSSLVAVVATGSLFPLMIIVFFMFLVGGASAK